MILLADSDGTVGEVEVRSPEGSATLSQARQAVAFDALDRPFEVSAAEIDTAFREALVAEPPPPVEFVVYFPLGSTRLTEASRVVWREVLAVLSERPVPEVSISGHADRVRSEAHNMKLSEARARSIHEKVVAAGIDPEMTDIAWYGETKPASPTADGSPEPLNRRVEVRIR